MFKKLFYQFFQWISYFGVRNNPKITTNLSEKVILSNRFGLVIFSYYVCYCLFFSYGHQWGIAITHFCVCLSVLFCFYLNHKHYYLFSRGLLLLAVNVGISAPDIVFGYVINAEIYFITSSLMTYLVFEFTNLKSIIVFSILPLFFWLMPRIFFTHLSLSHLSPAEMVFFQYANSIGAFISPNLWAIIFVQTIIENNKKVMQLNKFSSLGEMSAGLSHEINNPLTVIMASCNSMNNRIKSNNEVNVEEFSKYLEKSIYNSKRIARIVNGLRFFSRTSLADLKASVKIIEILRNTLDLCYENFASNQIKIDYPEDSEVSINCFAYEISQVLLNLLNNSRDAILGQEHPWIKIEIEKNLEEKNVRIAVIDSGTGINPQIVDKIMTPFFTTKEIGKGTGLGLSISKGIIESHGGFLSLDTKSPNTKFVLELPL